MSSSIGIAARIAAGALLLAAGSAQAAVFNPGFELGNFVGGDDVVKSGNTLTLKAAVTDYINQDGFNPITTTTVLTVLADASAPFKTVDPGIEWQFGAGTFDVDQGGTTLLEGTFSSLLLTTNGNFSAALTYTGGTLQGSFTGGDLVGSVFDSGFAPSQLLSADLTQDFTMEGVTSSKLGPVPVPPALVLFLPALGGLLAFRRR